MVERTLISFPSQLQLIERLQHLIYLSSSMVFISGEKGSGKSTLVEQLSNQLPPATQQAFIKLVEPISLSQIRVQIISQLFEEPLFDADDSLVNSFLLLSNKGGNDGVSGAVSERLNEKRKVPKHHVDVARVVVIDNATLLPEQLLNELAEVIKQKAFLTENEINFILLTEQSSTEKMLNQIKQSVANQGVATLAFNLPALAHKEAQQLLLHSFEQANYSPRVEHQDAVAQQLINCHGIPEKILALATQISSGHLEQPRSSWFKTRFPAILLMLSLIAIVIGLGFYIYPQFVKPQPEKMQTIVESDDLLLSEIPSTTLTTDSHLITAADNKQTTEALAGQWSSAKQTLVDNDLSVGIADGEERVSISELQLLDIGVSAGESTIMQAAMNEGLSNETAEALEMPVEVVNHVNSGNQSSATELATNEPVANELVNESLSNEVEDAEAVIEPVVFDKNNVEQLTTDSKQIELQHTESQPIAPPQIVEVKPLIAAPSALQPTDEITVKPNTEAKSVSELKSAAKSAPNGVFTGGDVLLAINPNLYTLQLSGMSSEKTLQDFIELHKLPRNDVYLYQTKRNGKNWYVVIYGQFKSRQAALREAKKLPDTLSKLDSWAKKYATVHQDIQLNE